MNATEGDPAPSYAAALAELDQILADLGADDLDVDALASGVRRAAELIRFCRARVHAARLEIEAVVVELDGDEEPDR